MANAAHTACHYQVYTFSRKSVVMNSLTITIRKQYTLKMLADKLKQRK